VVSIACLSLALVVTVTTRALFLDSCLHHIQ